MNNLSKYAEQAFGREKNTLNIFLNWHLTRFFDMLCYQFLSSMIYERSKIKLAVSTATCRPLSLAVKQSKVRLLVEPVASCGRQVCGAKGCRVVFKKDQWSSSWLLYSPQPHLESKSGQWTTEGDSAWADQKCPYFMSVRTSPPSCSKEPATDSNALQNASVISWSSVWVHPSSLRMLSGSLQV